MKPFKALTAARAAAAVLLCASLGKAQVAMCTNLVAPNNLVFCALRASFSAEAQAHAVEASRAREVAASPMLPSNPVLSATVGRRALPDGQRTYNWYASLSQEVEIAGQRGVRRRAAQAEGVAQAARLRVSVREVAAEAWSRYFEAVAAAEELALTTRLASAAQALSTAVTAKADNGLLPPVDADVTEVLLVRVQQARFAAERRDRAATSALASLLGLDPNSAALTVKGDLTPLNVDRLASPIATGSAERPEMQAAESERRALKLRAEAYRRSRIPNPTLTAFVENDGLDERVFGAGISIPIPLPGNLGRAYVGEIAEAEALARKAKSERELVRRDVRLEVVSALHAYESRQREISFFPRQRVERAARALEDLRTQVEAGRLPVRDAIVAQQSLVEFLQGELTARLELCLASVALARAVGFPLESKLP